MVGLPTTCDVAPAAKLARKCRRAYWLSRHSRWRTSPLPGRRRMQKPGDGSRSSRESNPAGYDVVELSESIRPLVEQAVGVSWYEAGNDVDAAVAALCRLRRAAAGARG